jgi:hypothetical protein
MRILTLLLTLGFAMFLNGCGTGPVQGYADTTPKIAAEEFFNGPVKAWGVVQSMSGKVVQKFDVKMVGKWQGNVGTLDEEFTYYDGKKQHRTWTITKLADGRYEGTAGDIVGKATGNTSGSAMQWNYVMDIPVDGKVWRITLDDWMFLMNDGVLINRSYLKKFGLTVAELTIVMQKGR